MSFKENIRRIALTVLWIAIASGVIVLLAAAIRKKDLKSCHGVEIDITGVDRKDFFLSKKDVLDLMEIPGNGKPEGRHVSSFNLQQLESALEKNVWVKDAELFFDNNLVLHVNIEEREPVARVFTVSGNSFYIDSSGKKLPLSDKMNVRLPVFTGFNWEKTTGLGASGKKQVDDMRKLAFHILQDKFWNAQVTQIDINSSGDFEIIPTIGNHIIQFGDSRDMKSKFRRLFIFYKEVLGKAGFDTYNTIDVRYSRQVVGTKKGSITKVDSVEAMKNIEQLIMAGKQIKADTIQITNP
ncbi:MAG: hypothetical protein H7Y03_08405 [Chitinophagaceae bacterium]|nr:hypothetical protein [Chitinophagaceae bacterium]